MYIDTGRVSVDWQYSCPRDRSAGRHEPQPGYLLAGFYGILQLRWYNALNAMHMPDPTSLFQRSCGKLHPLKFLPGTFLELCRLDITCPSINFELIVLSGLAPNLMDSKKLRWYAFARLGRHISYKIVNLA